MPKAKLNDGTDAFDTRLAVLRRKKAPVHEIDAAIAVYERVRTAQAICKCYLEDLPTVPTVLALVSELGREAALQCGQGPRSSE